MSVNSAWQSELIILDVKSYLNTRKIRMHYAFTQCPPFAVIW